MKFEFIKKLSEKVKLIDTLTTKLLMLILFIAIIPLIVSIDFSINIINQIIEDNLKNELSLYTSLFKEKSYADFEKLKIFANLYTDYPEYFIHTNNETFKPDFLLVVNKNKNIAIKINKYHFDDKKLKLQNVINNALLGQTSKSFELLAGEYGENIYEVLALPVFDNNNKLEQVVIIGKKLNASDYKLNISIYFDKYNIKLFRIIDFNKNIKAIKKSTMEKNDRQIIYNEPIKNSNGSIIGMAYMQVEKSSFIKDVEKSALIIRIISVISLLISIIIAALFSRSITTPILQLVNAAKVISKGNLKFRVKNRGNDEISQLGQSFNVMAESLLLQQQLKDNFVATLTHDLKVPMLAEKQTVTYMLKEIYGPLTPEQKEILELIKSTNSASLEMVATLLEVYRYDSGDVELVKSIFNVIQLFKDSVEEIKSLAVEKNIDIQIESEDTVLNVYADKREIKRVLHNLISNAITNGVTNGKIVCKADLIKFKCIYHPVKKPNLYTSLTNPIDITNSLIISITDNGIGISKNDISELFKRFSFNKGRKPSSTGLGLYYSNQVITKHEGHIWVESTVGEGCVFKFTIPLAEGKFNEQ